MKKVKIKIEPKARIGKLEILWLVTNVKSHELCDLTPRSYLSHGRIWECACDCGNNRLYSENTLQTGRLQSCGCLRQEIRQEAYQIRMIKLQARNKTREARFNIACLKDKLSLLKKQAITPERDLQIEKTWHEIRKYRAQIGHVTRNNHI